MPLMFLLYTARSTSQLNEYNMAKINARLEVECKANVILECMWYSVILYIFCYIFVHVLVHDKIIVLLLFI